VTNTFFRFTLNLTFLGSNEKVGQYKTEYTLQKIGDGCLGALGVVKKKESFVKSKRLLNEM
jgi:hypothetical protein